LTISRGGPAFLTCVKEASELKAKRRITNAVTYPASNIANTKREFLRTVTEQTDEDLAE